jgi:branched-chain amino acid transport system ATP-binding protein
MLRLRDVSAGYGGVLALRSASLSVDAGQMACLIGSNGAGKSTLLNTICGLVPARGGQISFDGAEITTHPTHKIARLGVLQVPEGRQVLAPLSVEENLRIGALARGGRAEGDAAGDLDKVFTLFPILQERRRQLAGSLSGGEQQMLAIGRAMMGRPRVLLLDEPSLGLAPQMIAAVYRALGELHRAGLSILLVEQNARRAMEISDYTYVIDQGVIVEHGPSRDMAHNPNVIAHYLGQLRQA